MIDTLLQFLHDALLEKLPELLMSILQWLIEAIPWLIVKIINFFITVISPMFDELDNIDMGNFNQLSDYWSTLPIGFIQLATAIKFPEALSVVLSALIIKYLKNKIPFMGK